MALRLCITVESFYSQVRNIFPRMSQDQEDIVSASSFPEALVGSFSLAQQKSWIRTSLLLARISSLILHSL